MDGNEVEGIIRRNKSKPNVQGRMASRNKGIVV